MKVHTYRGRDKRRQLSLQHLLHQQHTGKKPVSSLTHRELQKVGIAKEDGITYYDKLSLKDEERIKKEIISLQTSLKLI